MCNKCGVAACSGQHCEIRDLSPKPGGGIGNKKNTNPKDRMSADRLDLSLFPVLANAYGALAMTEGSLKYDPYNWREPGKGVRATVYYAACRRHMDKWLSREWEDPETGVPHLASALACIAILIDATETRCLKDDRPTFLDGDKEIFSGVMRMLSDKVKHLHTMFPQAPASTPEPSSLPPLEKKPQSDYSTIRPIGTGMVPVCSNCEEPLGGWPLPSICPGCSVVIRSGDTAYNIGLFPRCDVENCDQPQTQGCRYCQEHLG